jgi:hypothetical protein
MKPRIHRVHHGEKVRAVFRPCQIDESDQQDGATP